MNTGLRISALTLEFAHGGGLAAAVDRCDLLVQPGEIIGLVGESGSGKSLTGLACLGLLPANCRASGSVQLDAEQIIGAPESRLMALRGRRIAMIFQNPMTALNPYFSVGSQMVGVIGRHFGLGRAQTRAAALDALQQAGLTESALERYPHQMSGGQLQRVMIAMAIACKPRILIADEPTTALDVTVQARILNLLRRLADQGMGILLVSHDLGVVAQVADRVAVMYGGSVVECGAVTQVFSAGAHPYTRGLMQASPQLGLGRRKLFAIPGTVPDYRRRPRACTFADRCAQVQARCTQDAPAQTIVAPEHVARCHFPIVPMAPAAQ